MLLSPEFFRANDTLKYHMPSHRMFASRHWLSPIRIHCFFFRVPICRLWNLEREPPEEGFPLKTTRKHTLLTPFGPPTSPGHPQRFPVLGILDPKHFPGRQKLPQTHGKGIFEALLGAVERRKFQTSKPIPFASSPPGKNEKNICPVVIPLKANEHHSISTHGRSTTIAHICGVCLESPSDP